MRLLPEGLSFCADCDEIRGKTPNGRLSVCYCQGVVCEWCELTLRRPITEYFDPAGPGYWVHVPYYLVMDHAFTCESPARSRVGPQFRPLPIDNDLKEYGEAMTRLTHEYLCDEPPRRTARRALSA